MFHWKRVVTTSSQRRIPLHRSLTTLSGSQINSTSQEEWKTLGVLGAATVAAAIAVTSLFTDATTSTTNKWSLSSGSRCDCEGQVVSPNNASSFVLDQVYEIEQVLGEGAYGQVYKARRKADGTLVALKTMPRALTGQTDFEREVAALQWLSKNSNGGPHANIVQLYDLHRDDQNYYLAMELVEGGELFEHLIENGAYSEGLAASFLRQFAEAICFVHSNGLAHADLKPENLLLSKVNNDGKQTLKLCDFGCAFTHDESRKDMHLPAQEFARGCSFLHMVALGNQFELEKLLQERPSLVNFRDYDFRTPLHLAASEGHVDICRFLVSRGARINRSDRWGGSPLDDAVRHKHSEVIQYLREQGATFGSLTQLPRFIQAASEGDVAEVKAILEFGNHVGDLINQGDYDRRTALHLACGEGRIEIVDLLCRAGANVNVQDRWGNRPLDDAKQAKKNSQQIMKLLTQYGAKSTKNPSLHLIRQFLASEDTKRKADSSMMYLATQSTQREKDMKQTITGTTAYWPPELFVDNATPTPASDMWAAGVIMYILLTGTHPLDKYADLSDDQIKQTIIEVGKDKQLKLMDQIVFDERVEDLSDSCIELMRKLLHPDPKSRMNSETFLRHPWTQGLTASWTAMGKAHNELKAFWQNKFRAEILKDFAASLGISSGNNNLSDKDIERIFRALDIKKTGVLELDEIQTAFRDHDISDHNLRTIFASADLDGTGVIHFDEFQALLRSKHDNDHLEPLHVGYLQQRFKSHVLKKFVESSGKKAVSDDGQLREIFNKIDLEGNGCLDPYDIRVFLRSEGEPEDVISRIFAAVDINQDGKISWKEFLQVMGVTNK